MAEHEEPNATEGQRERAKELLKILEKECGELTEPEQKLAWAAVMGKACDLLRPGDEELTADSSPFEDWGEHRTVRAGVLRALCVRPDTHALIAPRGVDLDHAAITGELNLTGADVPFDLVFGWCAFEAAIVARSARTRTVSLHGSHVPGLNAAGLETRGDVYLRRGFEARGEVRLVGATIGGNLDCEDGSFCNRGDRALNADSATVSGTLFLREARIDGIADLTRSRIDYLNDGPDLPVQILLGDCRYDAIDSGSPLSAKARLAWLDNHDQTIRTYTSRDHPPDPQPYRWLASILRRQGHERDADKVMERIGWLRMKPLREQRCQGNRWAKLKGWTYWGTSWIYGAIVGHGYARFRPLLWLLGFWLFGSIIFAFPLGETMQPTQAYALKAWSEAGAAGAGAAGGAWLDDLPKFNPIVYSLDAFLPLVDFHQEEYWTPRSGPTAWRWIVKQIYLPFHIIMGWVIATLFAASFTKLARHD